MTAAGILAGEKLAELRAVPGAVDALRELLAADADPAPAQTFDVRALLDELVRDPEALEAVAVAAARAPIVYTTASLGSELGVDERTVRRAISDGQLRAHRRCGRWVILAEDVAQWVRAGQGPVARARGPRPRRSTSSRGAAAMRAASGGTE